MKINFYSKCKNPLLRIELSYSRKCIFLSNPNPDFVQMTTLQTIQTEYIRYANRTLECVEVRSENLGYRHYWIYNYQGIHFSVFGSEIEALTFLNNEPIINLIF